MRANGFLRTPIRADHQDRMENVTLTERPFVGNPSPSEPYPQTLEITFTPAAGVTEIQLAPCWEGDLFFIADDSTGYPTRADQVVQANAANWPLVGDLVLVTSRDLGGQAKALLAHTPLLESAPNVVRYSKVRLTTDFLFTTLAQASLKAIVVGGQLKPYTAQTMHAQLVVQFLKGDAGVPCAIDPQQPARDFALQPMPVLVLQAAPLESVLRLGMSCRTNLPNSWFAARPEDPQIPNSPLVDPALSDERHARFSPAHPSHSFVPPRALFQDAAQAAYPVDHWGSALRTLLAAPLADAAVYRRIALKRPPIPGAVRRFPTRPYPLYQLRWLNAAAGTSEAQRIPIDGVLYLPLADDTYLLLASRRIDDPPGTPDLEEFAFGLQTPPNKFLDLPLQTVEITLEASQRVQTVYVHLLRYDSDRIWEASVELGYRYRKLIDEATVAWGLPFVNRWIIYVPDTAETRRKTGAMKDYGRIHGFIRASAGRHGLAPEFLHAVVMGENMVGHIEYKWSVDPPLPFVLDEVISGFTFLGLDRIWDSTLALGADHYLDDTRFGRNALANHSTFENPEDHSTAQTADPIGWEAAVEFVAAELHARRDWMLGVLGKPLNRISEQQNRFLAYARYVSSEGTSTAVARQMTTLLAPWEGPAPPAATDHDPLPVIVTRVRYKCFQRLAVADWLEKSQIYR
jgi:hypothetical protein